MNSTNNELLDHTVERLSLLEQSKLNPKSVYEVMKRMNLNKVKSTLDKCGIASKHLTENDHFKFKKRLDELIEEKECYIVEVLANEGLLINGDVYTAYKNLGVLDKIKEYENKLKRKNRKESFLEKQGFIDKNGNFQKLRLAVCAGVIAAGALGYHSIFNSDTNKKEPVSIYREIDQETWGTKENRDKYIKNLESHLNILEIESDFGSKETINMRKKEINDYLKKIESNDPNFERENPELYKKLQELKTKYMSIQ